MPEPIAELAEVQAFREQVAKGTAPAVLRGGAGHWKSVAAGADGADAIERYLRRKDSGTPVYTIVGSPSMQGRFGFSADTRSVNYDARQTPLSSALARFPEAARGGFSVAVQAARARAVLSDWEAENRNTLAPADAEPTVWISMKSSVAPHADVHDNVAVVVAGSRRFTLFPPEHIKNLYLGPLLSSPGGVPTSSVNFREPDRRNHPRFARAERDALAATLMPGDTIFIPALWWHGVESLESFNVLVNFWFGGNRHDLSPSEAMAHAILAISSLPRHQRARWRRYFEHLVFRLDEDPAEHLPGDLEDLISQPNGEQVGRLLKDIGQKLIAKYRD
jgi:hypothetical protein